MEEYLIDGKKGILGKGCSNLLEFLAKDDVAGFRFEVEEKGVDIDEVSYWYGRRIGSKKMGLEERTPLLIASLFGSLQIMKYIIETGKVDVNRASSSDRATALHCAAASGASAAVDAVKLLLNSLADVNSIDANGNRPGDLLAPATKFSTISDRKTLELLLKGRFFQEEEEEQKMIAATTPEKKEYPVDIALPDINTGTYGSDEFRMYSFKVKPCSRAYSHDWTECPFVHPGENARRRDPRKYNYSCVPCPEFKKGTCFKADSCEYAHGVFESWLHPAQYRTRLCKDETGCARKVCFFAHRPEELRPLYASTGSGMPSPKSGAMDFSTSTPPMSPVVCSSPVSGNMWQNKVNLTPPTLQLPGSRLKTTVSARDLELEMEFRNRQQLIDELTRLKDLKPTNLDDIFGSLDHHFHGVSPKVSSAQLQQSSIQQNIAQLRATYPSNVSSSPASYSSNLTSPAPARISSPYGFDTAAAVAAAVMNSRSSTFTNRSQSFNYRHNGLSSTTASSKFSDWSSPDGKLDWEFRGEDMSKLTKSASFGYRNAAAKPVVSKGIVEQDGPWVNSLTNDWRRLHSGDRGDIQLRLGEELW